MEDENKSREQLIIELIQLRQRNEQLERQLCSLEIFEKESFEFDEIKDLSYFLDFTTDILAIVGLDNTLRYINSSSLNLMGYSKEEIFLKSATEAIKSFVYPEDQEKVLTAFQQTLSGKLLVGFDSRSICKDGSYKWFSWTAIPFMAKSIVYFIAKEITDKKLMQEKFEKASQQVTNTLETITDSFFALDKSWRFTYVNRGAENHFGKLRVDLLGEKLLDQYPQIYGKAIYREIEKVRLTQMPSYLEFESVITRRWYEGRIFPTQEGLSIFFIDITERKEAEKELEMSKRRFLKMFNMSPYIMCIKKLSDGRLIEVNKTFERQTGYSRKETLGHTLLELNALTNQEDYRQMLKVLQNNGSIVNEELSYITRSGELRDVLISAEIVELDGKNVILASLNDITERKKIEEEMARLDRLNLIGQMAAGIGHEIRNPMTTIRGTLQILGKKKEFSQHSKYFDTMIEEIDRCNSIITEFLSLAKIKPSNLEQKNLNDILYSLYPLMLADALNQNKVIKLNGGNISLMMVNEKEIRQLILNLVHNGLEAMPSKGAISIKTYLDGEEIVLAIKDQGEGIKPHILNKLGTPFFTTKNEGTGLGLAVCYSIAARHNAIIEIQTNSNGTIFLVKFRERK